MDEAEIERRLTRIRKRIDAIRSEMAELASERDELIRLAAEMPRDWGRFQRLANAAGITRGRVSQIAGEAETSLEGLR